MTKDIEREHNKYLAELLEREVIKKDDFEDIVFKPEINAFHSNYLSARFMDNMNFGWSSWQAAKAHEAKKLEGCVVVPESEYHEMAQFKDLYKRAIVNAKKRKDQLNWAHVAGLGIGSTKAIGLLKEFGIDPSATSMHAVLEEPKADTEG